MPSEFIAVVVSGTVQRVWRLILGWMVRDVSVMIGKVPVSDGIHVLHGRRMDDVLRELQEKCA